MASLSTVLKAFWKSTFKNTLVGSPALRCIHCRTVCTVASLPKGMATPTWRGQRWL